MRIQLQRTARLLGSCLLLTPRFVFKAHAERKSFYKIYYRTVHTRRVRTHLLCSVCTCYNDDDVLYIILIFCYRRNAALYTVRFYSFRLFKMCAKVQMITKTIHLTAWKKTVDGPRRKTVKTIVLSAEPQKLYSLTALMCVINKIIRNVNHIIICTARERGRYSLLNNETRVKIIRSMSESCISKNESV